MSESAKMGLFGSKDENTGDGTTGDESGELPKTKGNSPDCHGAPYNIDSDSETYDTEALSIMDINDIIGVQAETAGDSTLESEFAALSEVITNCKEEFSPKISGSPDGADNTVDTRADSQADDKKSHDSAGMASISKSLQLIGEAYISEDSQETDTEEIPESNTPKLTNLGECLRASRTEDAEKIAEKVTAGSLESSGEQTTATAETIAVSVVTDLKDNSVMQETVEEPKKCIEGTPKTSQIEISVDSTDCTTVDNKSIEKSIEEDKTESMDIDSSPLENILETVATENQSDCKAESSEEKKVVDDSHVKSTVIEAAEQPMEVDQANDEISTNISNEKIDSVNTEEAIDDKKSLAEPLVSEEKEITSNSNAVKAEESKTVVDVDEIPVDDKTSSHSENVEELVASIIKSDEPIEIEKVIEEKPAKPFESSASEKSETERSEMETDDNQIERSVEEKVASEKLESTIEKSVEQMASTVDNVAVEVSAQRKDDSEEKSESSQKAISDMEKETPLLVREIVEAEPMEVDDNLIDTQTETESEKPIVTQSDISENNSEIIESLANISSKEISTVEPTAVVPEVVEDVSNIVETIGDEALQTTLVKKAIDESVATAVLENSSTSVESLESKTVTNIASKENSTEESVASVPELSVESPAEMLEIAPKKSTIEESLSPAAETFEKSSAIVSPQVEVTADSALDDFGIRIPTESVPEDEKMEVDGGVKREKGEEQKNKNCQPEAASQDVEKSPPIVVPEVRTDDSIETNSTIGEAVESDIPEVAGASSPLALPEMTQTDKTIKESIEVPVESPNTTSHEKETKVTFADDNVTEGAEDKDNNDISLKNDSKVDTDEVPIFIENTDKSLKTEAPETPDDEIANIQEDDIKPETAKEEKELLTSIENSEPSIVNEAVKTVDDLNGVKKNEFSTSIEMAESSTEKCSEADAIETFDVAISNDEELQTEPQKNDGAKESLISIEVPETIMHIEAATIGFDAVEEENKDAKNKEIQTKEGESSIIMETAVCDVTSVTIENTVPEQTMVESDVEKGSSREPEKIVSVMESQSQEVFSEPNISREATSPKDASSIMTNLNDAEENSVQEKISLSLHAEVAESPENRDDKTESITLPIPSEQKPVEPEDGIEDHAEMNLSPDPEEKIYELSSVHIDKGDEKMVAANAEMNPSLDPEEKIVADNAEMSPSLAPEEKIVADDAEMSPSLDPEEKIVADNAEMSPSLDLEEKIVADNAEMSPSLDPEEKIIADNAEMISNPDLEEKINELPSVPIDESNKTAVEDCVEESSMTSTTDKLEDLEERFEKPCDDIDENSKDIEPTTVSVPEIFHDEQSQTTQEMMESILETDTGNINKILDDEEAEGEALARSNALPLEATEIDELSDKLPSESDELLNKELDDPMSSQNIDSLEGLLDLDLMPESDEPALKVVEPIVEKVMNEADEDIEDISKDVDVSLLLDENEQTQDYSSNVSKDIDVNVVNKEITEAVEIEAKSILHNANQPAQLASPASELTDNDLDAAFDLSSVVPNALDADPLVGEDTKMDLDEELLREIAVDEERKMELARQLFLESSITEESKIDLPDDLLLETAVPGPSKIDEVLLDNTDAEQDIVLADPDLLRSTVQNQKNIVLDDPILLQAVVPEDSKIELSEDISLESAVRDHVLTDVVTEIEDLAPNSEISELESAVKFLQESEEQDIDSPLVLSPKLVESVVDDIAQEADVGIFAGDADMCEDPTELVAELESIIPDPIAISEAEIISEAAKLESERKTKEEAELLSPIAMTQEKPEEDISRMPSPLPNIHESSANISSLPETPKTHRESRETIIENPIEKKVENEPLLKKSVPIPKISILEERLKIPPKIEIPVGEVSRICEMPTTPKTSLLIQRDAKLASYQKMLESPKSSEKSELKIVDTPRKESEKHDFENVGSPRIILKIAKSAIADCGEPRSPKSPKIRSATNSPNPDDSPGHKLGKIKLKLSKGGHPSIIPNDNVEEICGQWHTEGTSSLSPLGMKIKFSKTGDASIVQTEKHEPPEETTKEQPKHKFEEAKRTESPIGMKIKLSRTGDPSIVQQDAKESIAKHKDKLDIMQGSPKRTESPIGMKIKLSKSGDASIIQPEKQETSDEYRESSRGKDKLDAPQDVPRRTESPLGMKIKLFKTGDASIVPSEIIEDSPQDVKRTDSPLGMKIKLSKTGGATIVPVDSSEEPKEKLEVPEMPRRTESPLGMKFKLSKSGDASIIHSEESKESAKHKESQDAASESSMSVKYKVTKSGDSSIVQPEPPVDSEVRSSSIGMKIKLSKTGDASIVHSDSQEQPDDSRVKERDDKPESIGMKIKLSKTGDASIIPNPKKSEEPSIPEITDTEHKKPCEAALGMKIKLQKGGDASIVETDKKDKSSRRKDTELPLEMKIKLSKTGHPTIIACDNYGESSQRSKDSTSEISHKHKESLSPKENPGMKMLKTMQSTNMHGGRSELTIEPIQLHNRKTDVTNDGSPKRKEITISPIESKKAKLEAKLSQMLPEVTIQPITPRDQKKMMFDAKANSISRQQMNVISQEISITQVRPNKPMDLSMTDKLKSMLTKNPNPNAASDCEIIEPHPELIIVNENSNSSQEVMIIEEVPALRGPDAKVPKKRGRPRRNPLPLILAKPLPQSVIPAEPSVAKDPLSLDDVTHTVGQLPPQNFAPKENERPKRTCSRQKSYAPPRRGRGRGGGRGKRKMEMAAELGKKPRIEQDLDAIEHSTTALITIDEPASQPDVSHSTSELYKALRQPPMDAKMSNTMARTETKQAANDAAMMAKSRMESLMDSRLMSHLGGVMETNMKKSTTVEGFDSERKMSLESLCASESQIRMSTDQMEKSELLTGDDKIIDKVIDDVKDIKDAASVTDHQNWLTPSSKKQLDGRNEGNMSNVQVIDEETRMSAESGSRSQTPARNMSIQAPETIVNEESQGSVLSTATTESEKVKVKNRRMEINFDPDEGPFTVDKVAEYEWPPDPTRKSETFMIQEQISQYLGVKSFKRKYPDLKRRMVDMEERNFLRENALVSEAMCDMGLTAVSSSEVLDVMCSDFPDQYEEYRKYIRDKQMKEHSKKQKELTAAANAERNRIDLAEMAVQSALSWNVGLNKARRESRKCSLDLQTFTIHVPKKQQKVEEESKISHYPVALIPGQYTDYYREYTPAELRYYPLNTVLYGPMKPNERKFDSQSEGSQSDSDSDSSSDDSSSSSSDGTQDTEESQSTMDEVDVELSRQKEDIKSIKCKMCLKHLNKFSRTEVLIQCGTCNGYVHPSCIDLTLDMVPHIQAYAWQCTDCKTCAQCHDPADEDKMLFCDMCDRGYHIYCVGLRRVPQGRWHCQECAVCASCGSREAGGANSDRNSVAQWQHEYKKGDKNTRVYVSTLCVPCSKLWRKGRYCPHCSRCHTVPRLDLEANLVHCSACDKYLHLGCVETKDLTIDRKNYLCDFCQPSRQQMVKPLVSKVFRT